MKKIRFAVVGTGRLADEFAEIASGLENLEFVSVYSSEEEKAIFFAQKYDITRVATTLKELTRDALDFVYISSNISWHYKHAKYILEKKISLIIQSPICLNVDQLQDLYETAMRNNVYFLEGTTHIHHPYVREIKKNISMNNLGKVRSVNLNIIEKTPEFEDYKKGLNVDLFDKSLAGGAIYKFGNIPINVVLYIFGYPNNIESYCLERSSEDVDMYDTIIFEYKNFNAIINVSIIAKSLCKSEIIGEDGNITIDSVLNLENVILHTEDSQTKIGNDFVENGMKYYVEKFLQIITEDDLDAFEKYYTISNRTAKAIDEIFRQIGN